MKIGVVGTAFECEDDLSEAIKPWVEAKSNIPIEISIVSCRFKEYSSQLYENKPTIEKLQYHLSKKHIEHLFLPNEPLFENEARNLALSAVIKCDLIWLVDFSDEVYSKDEIVKTYSFLTNNFNKFYPYFNLEFKNYIFDKKTYIKGFEPSRIWRTQIGNYQLNSFFYDNDILYIDKNNNIVIKDSNLSRKKIPIGICNPRHYTWLNNDRSRKKIAYQEKHFAHGAGCSFRWGDKGLEWNEEYFVKTREGKPQIFHE